MYCSNNEKPDEYSPLYKVMVSYYPKDKPRITFIFEDSTYISMEFDTKKELLPMDIALMLEELSSNIKSGKRGLLKISDKREETKNA
jgi:hypothetical protein